MNPHIYADNAATTKLDLEVFESMTPWLLDEYGNASQPYSFSRKPKKALASARETIASCINAIPEEIYFTSGGTESDNWAVKGSFFAEKANRLTITSSFEHNAVLNACKAIESLNHPVSYLTPSKEGYITPEILKRSLTDNTGLVSVMYANNEIGTVQPIKDLCKAVHEHGAVFHTDAVQAVGHVRIDVQDLEVDMLSASAHKFNGPKGVGFLYIKNGTKILPYSDGGAQERHMRAGTENVASIVGMAEALKNNCSNLVQNTEVIKNLENQLTAGLVSSGVPFVRNGGQDRLPGLLSLSFPGLEGEAILHRMDLMGISISTGSACDSVNTEISHVLKAVGLEEVLAKGTIRISLGKNNTSDEVDRIVEALVKIVKG